MKHIGEAIKAHRKSSGIKQGELSVLVGLSQTAMSQIERGVAKPNQSSICSICQALKVTESELVISLFTDKELIEEIGNRLDNK